MASILDLAELIAGLHGRAPGVRLQPPRDGNIRLSLGVRRAATARLDIAARTRLEDRLRRILGYDNAAG